MSNSHITVPGTTNNLQTYENVIGGVDVHSEAVTLTDTAGNPINTGNALPVQGSAATNAALAGNPILIAGSDGTLTRVPTVVANGAAPSSNLFVMATGAFDGANLRALSVDTTGAIKLGNQQGSVSDATSNTAGNIGWVQTNNLVFNGTTWDRLRSGTQTGSILTALSAGNPTLGDANSNTILSAQNSAGNVIQWQTFPNLYNGTTWDRWRSASVGNNVAATGISAAGMYGQFNTILPTLTSGNFGVAQLDSSGRLLVNVATGGGGGNNTGSFAQADAQSNTENTLATAGNAQIFSTSLGYVFNGTTWDRMRSGTGTGSVLVNNGTAANLLATVTQTAGNWNENLAQVNGTTTSVNTGTADAGSIRAAIGTAAAAAQADANSNTVALQPPSLSYGVLYNGTTWDRQPGNTNGTFIQGPVASGSASTARPTIVGGVDSTGNAQTATALVNGSGKALGAALLAASSTTLGDAATNAPLNIGLLNSSGTLSNFIYQPVFGHIFNGTTWERSRSAVVGNNVAATGISIAAGYGQYTTIANQPALTTGNYAAHQLDSAGNQKVVLGAPAIGNILAGLLTHTATTAAATIVTVPAGKTFRGKVTVSVTLSKAGAATGNGEAIAVVSTAGTGVTPAAGNYFAVSAFAGANVAAGLTGTEGQNCGSQNFIVNAPAGNSVTIQGATTINSATDARVDYSVFGEIQ